MPPAVEFRQFSGRAARQIHFNLWAKPVETPRAVSRCSALFFSGRNSPVTFVILIAKPKISYNGVKKGGYCWSLNQFQHLESEGVMSLRITIKNRLQQNDSYDLECNIAPKESLWG